MEKTKFIYKYWQNISNNFSKPYRFGLGGRIENLFIDILELEFIASFKKPDEKETLIANAIMKFDILKFLCQVSWENSFLKKKIYIFISKELDIIGRELSGWKKYLEIKNSRQHVTREMK